MAKKQHAQKQEDQTVCTHCRKVYTKRCSIKKYCKVHRGQCFSCRHCIQPSQKAQLQACSICSRLSSKDELLYDAQCDKYYCVLQFLNYPLQNSKSLKFQCSHKISRKKFMDVIKNFCYNCGRKKPEKRQKKSDELYKCRLCILKQEQSTSLIIEQRQKIQKQQNSNQDHYDRKSKCIIQQILKSKTQKQCIICLEQFDQENHVPYMICIRQHMICDKCLSSVRTCPLCKLKIDKKHCLPYRNILERIKLEKIASENQQKFQTLNNLKINQESPIKINQNELPQKEKIKKMSLDEIIQKKKLQQKRQKHLKDEQQIQRQQQKRKKQAQLNQQKNSWNSSWLFKTISEFFKKE